MNFLNKIFLFDSFKRKVILINPPLQFSIINYVTLLFFFVVSAFYGVNVFFIYELKQKGIKAGLPLNSEYFQFLENTSHLMNLIFLFSALVILLVIYFFGLRLSHRLAGPIYKINMTIDNVLTNKKKIKIVLRKNDYFKDHAEKINKLIDELKLDQD